MPTRPNSLTRPVPPHAQIEDLSRQFLAFFYRHDVDRCLELCAPDVSYLGCTLNGFASGADTMSVLLKKALAMYRTCIVVSVETQLRELSDDCFVVLARYYVVSDPSLGRVRARRRRGTLIWSTATGSPLLTHMHFSIPLETSADGLATMADNSHATVRYAEALLEHVISRSGIVLNDVRGTTHRVSVLEVRYVEAARQHSVVHCLKRDVIVRRSFRSVVDDLGSPLLQVHRSYAINPDYVQSVSSSMVVLDDGTKIPLPQRRAREMRQRIFSAMQTQASDRLRGLYPFSYTLRDEAAGAAGALLGFTDASRW